MNEWYINILYCLKNSKPNTIESFLSYKTEISDSVAKERSQFNWSHTNKKMQSP